MSWATTLIIGGGPSAGPLDAGALAGLGMRLGVNDAALHKPVDAFFSNDHNYVLGIRPALEALTVPLHFSVWHSKWHLFEGWRGPQIWRRVSSAEPSQAPGCLSSGPYPTPGCSGFVAINLAVQMGARRVVLFGYDFHDDYKYFFDTSGHDRKQIEGVRKSFADVAPHYRRRCVEIVNANPDSAITAFARMTHQEAIAWAAAPL